MSLTCTKTTQSATYHFHNAEQHDWFIAVICDKSGSLMIIGDHGDWSFRWGLAGLTTTLTREIGDRFGTDYMANKLCPKADEFDEEATRAACIEYVREYLTGDDATDAVALLENASWDDERDAYETLSDSDVSEIFDYPPDFIKTRPTHSFLHLCDAYLPALKTALAPPKELP